MALRFWREEVVTTPALASGQRYNVELSQLQQTRDGRPVHVLGFEFSNALKYSATGSAGLALPGTYVRSVLTDIVIRSGDHRWCDSLDGDEMHALSELRMGQPFLGRLIDADEIAALTKSAATAAGSSYDQTTANTAVDLVNELRTNYGSIRTLLNEMRAELQSVIGYRRAPDPADIPDTSADETSRTEMVRYMCSYLGASPWDGAIPLSALNERRGANRVEFSIAKGFKGSSDYTVDECTVTVYAICCTRDEERMPTPHKMRAYDEQRTDMVIRPEGRALAILIRDTRDAGGDMAALDHDAYTDLTLTVDDEVIFQSAGVADLIDNLNDRAPLGAQTFEAHEGTPFVPITLAQPREKRTSMHSGKFRLQIRGSRKDAAGTLRTSSRILIHETGRHTDSSTSNFKRTIGAPLKGVFLEPRFAEKGARAPTHPARDILDAALYWPGMKSVAGEVPSKKFAQKAAAKK